MIILYYTNKDINDWNTIPGILKEYGDIVLTKTEKFDLDFIIDNNIEFIVSDRSRYLISADIIEYLDGRIVNLHPSFLPWNKGYHPNYWSIKEKTPYGVTIHHIDNEIDTGNIIAQTRYFYNENDTLRDTYDRLRALMVGLFDICWNEIREGRAKGVAQYRDKGSLHYKSDFDGVFEKLKHGWDTKIKDIE